MPADWATPRDVTARADKLWASGAILRELHTPAPDSAAFPNRVRLPGPRREDLTGDLTAAIAWATALTSDATRRGWRIETRRVSGGIHGSQIIPVAAHIDTPQVALALLPRDRADTARRYTQLLTETRSLPLPTLVLDAAEIVALRHPHTVLDAAAAWPTLLAVTAWLLQHPYSGKPARQVPVAGIHTKLIEQNTKLLRTLLDTADPGLADPAAASFAGRYGLATPARMLRLRGTGPALGLPHLVAAEVYWPVEGLAGSEACAGGIRQVVIVENVITFQAIPIVPGRLVLWGSGKEVAELLHPIDWLRNPTVDVVYWGDLDTHGFHILSVARAAIPHLRSILMEQTTLLTHKAWWGTETTPYTGVIDRLTSDEAETLRVLRDGNYGTRLRLEQEYIPLDDTFTRALNQE